MVKKNVDLVKESGKYGMHQEYVEFEIKNRKVYSNGVFCEGAYNPDSKSVSVVLKKTNFDNPKIDGLVVLKGKLSDTDYHQ